jgi:hypothetical protein
MVSGAALRMLREEVEEEEEEEEHDDGGVTRCRDQRLTRL